jgi:hypothetical protein
MFLRRRLGNTLASGCGQSSVVLAATTEESMASPRTAMAWMASPGRAGTRERCAGREEKARAQGREESGRCLQERA